MGEQVIILNGRTGFYWRENSCGYTATPLDAGIYDSDKMAYVLKDKDRRDEFHPVPENHISNITTLRNRVTALESANADLKAEVERWKGAAEKSEKEFASELEQSASWQSKLEDIEIKLGIGNGSSIGTEIIDSISALELRAKAAEEQLLTAEKEVAQGRKLLAASEDFRRAYQDGKYKLYASENEAVREAAAEHLPCNEGPLDRQSDSFTGVEQLKRRYNELNAKLLAAEALAERLRDVARCATELSSTSICVETHYFRNSPQGVDRARILDVASIAASALTLTPSTALSDHDRSVRVACLEEAANLILQTTPPPLGNKGEHGKGKYAGRQYAIEQIRSMIAPKDLIEAARLEGASDANE